MNLENIDETPVSTDIIEQVALEMSEVWGFTLITAPGPILWGVNVHPEGRPEGTKAECLRFEGGVVVVDFSSEEHVTLPNIWHEVCHVLQPHGMTDGRYIGNPAEIEAHCLGFSAELSELGVDGESRKALACAMTEAVGGPANLMPALITLKPQMILRFFAEGELAAVCLEIAETMVKDGGDNAAEFDEIAQRLRAL